MQFSTFTVAIFALVAPALAAYNLQCPTIANCDAWPHYYKCDDSGNLAYSNYYASCEDRCSCVEA